MPSEWKKTTPQMQHAPEKCDPEARRFCKTMENALGDTLVNSHVKGLTVVEVTDTKTLLSRVIGVAYKKSARDSGLMLNHCPFCGVGILWVAPAARKAG